MKKRLLATICALALVAGMSITTVAAPSPALQQLIAANTDIEFEAEEAPVAVSEVSAKAVEVKAAPAQLKVAVMEAVQKSLVAEIKATKGAAAADDFRFLNLVFTKGKNQAVKTDYTVKYDMPTVTNADLVKAYAFNTVTKVWEQIPAATRNGEVYVLTNNVYSAVFFVVDGVVPESMRFASAASTEEITETLVGGKDEMTSIVVSADAYEAPFTGETDVVIYLAIAAIAFAGIFAVSGKKLLA